MRIPPIQPFDINTLDPVKLEVVLLLPPLAEADVQAGSRLFSAMLADGGFCDAAADPRGMVELLTRCLLAVTAELLAEPETVLRLFDPRRFGPRFERCCDVLTPSGTGVAENARWLQDRMSDWGLTEGQRAVLRASVVTIAVGSLATIGRLPLSEVPDCGLN